MINQPETLFIPYQCLYLQDAWLSKSHKSCSFVQGQDKQAEMGLAEIAMESVSELQGNDET